MQFSADPINCLSASNYHLFFPAALRCSVCHNLHVASVQHRFHVTLDYSRHFDFTPAAEMAPIELVLSTCIFGTDLLLNLSQRFIINRAADSRKLFRIWLLRLLLATATQVVSCGMSWHEYCIHGKDTSQEGRSATLVIDGTLWWNTVTEGLFCLCSVFPVFSKYPWTVVSICLPSFVLLATNWILSLIHPGSRYSRFLVAFGHVTLKLSLIAPWSMFTYKVASAEKMKLVFIGLGLSVALALSILLGFLALRWPSISYPGFNQVFFLYLSSFTTNIICILSQVGVRNEQPCDDETPLYSNARTPLQARTSTHVLILTPGLTASPPWWECNQTEANKEVQVSDSSDCALDTSKRRAK